MTLFSKWLMVARWSEQNKRTGDKTKRRMITQVGQKLIGKRTGNDAKNRSSTSRIKNYVYVGFVGGCTGGCAGSRSDSNRRGASTSGGGEPGVGTIVHLNSTSLCPYPVSVYDLTAPSLQTAKISSMKREKINIINFLHRHYFIPFHPWLTFNVFNFFSFKGSMKKKNKIIYSDIY